MRTPSIGRRRTPSGTSTGAAASSPAASASESTCAAGESGRVRRTEHFLRIVRVLEVSFAVSLARAGSQGPMEALLEGGISAAEPASTVGDEPQKADTHQLVEVVLVP
mmetsp:Transcript_17555/g.48457  ORF Transcript_17555/g.48457 Transcript_17555/m.48457 type:complete len:108 (-) Transcript_17555:29-352(-)